MSALMARSRGAIFEKHVVAACDTDAAMRITLNSIPVDDQDKALTFYAEVLGFQKKHDIPVGNGFRWLTLVSPKGHDDVELVLEPNAHPASKAYQEALLADGIPITAFEVDDVAAEFERLSAKGVTFTQDPKTEGPVTIAIFADTCGNLIQIYEPPASK